MNSKINKSSISIIAIFFAIVSLIFTLVLVISNVSHAGNGQKLENGRLITIHDRGTQKVILSQAETIGDAIKESGIKLDKNDAVEPSVDKKLIASDYQVNIYRARPVTVIDGNIRQKIITPYQTADQIISSAGMTLYPEDEVSISSAGNLSIGTGIIIKIDRATPFTFTLYGNTNTIRTQANTVGEMLKEKNIKMNKNDQISVGLETKITSDLTIRLWREGKQTVTVDEDIEFSVEKIQDADQEVGFRSIRTIGDKGKRSVTYEIVIQDGEEVSRTEIASLTTKEPKSQVEIVGSKNRYSSSLNEWLLALRTCETNNVYTRNSGNGFFGAYQFMISTWDAVAPKVGRPDLRGVRPDLASPADQDFMVVANANLSRGGLATQHPGCYKKLGLSQFPPN